jgi:hypothetical protein
MATRGGATGSEGGVLESSPVLQLGLAVCAVKWLTTAKQLVPTASPTVAEIDGELLRRSTGSEGEIGWRYGAMSSGEVARRGRDERGRRWCEGMSAGRPAFIAAEGGRGSALMSMVVTSLQGAEWMAMTQRGWRGPGGDAGRDCGEIEAWTREGG